MFPVETLSAKGGQSNKNSVTSLPLVPPANEKRDKRGSGSCCDIGCVWLGLLLVLLIAHVTTFLIVTHIFNQRINLLELQTLAYEKNTENRDLDSVLNHVKNLVKEPDDRFGHIRSKKDASNIENNLQTKQLQSIRQHLREDIADVIKALASASSLVLDERGQILLDERLSNWVKAVHLKADDNNSRRATTGNELGGIFDELANSEMHIFERYCGNSSKICLPGAKGDSGTKGSTGDKGEQGTPGMFGPKGSRGIDGMPGLKGLPGERGSKGEPGSAGHDGQKGETGSKGDMGSSGPPGPKGIDGLAGMPGLQGLKGEAGSPGMKGDPGIVGEKGESGSPGQTGLPGRKGEKGSDGTAGSSGPPGPKGRDGLSGMPGLKGISGEKGEPGQSIQGSTGPPGQKGEPGISGRDGSPGPKGEQGTAGSSGPPGPKGSMGYPGLPGAKGETGDSGSGPYSGSAGSDCCSALKNPLFLEEYKKVVTEEGENVTLNCDTGAYPPATVTWQPPGILQNPKYVKIGDSLIITNVDSSDAQNLSCVATNILGSAQKVFDLNVLQHLVVKEKPSNLTVKEGQPLQLECRFNPVIPPPVITWYHLANDGSRVPVTSGVTQTGSTSVLDKPSASVADQGTYVCEATNGLETSSLQDNVNILSKPYITQTSGPIINAGKGEDVVLHCSSDSVPTPIIHWTHDRNDSHVYEDAQGDLHLEDVRSMDSGKYTCTATNSLGTDQRDLTVQVQVPPIAEMQPEVMPLKPTLFFDCTVTGDKPITVSWSKDGTALSTLNSQHYIHLPDQVNGAHRLLVMGTSETDVGVYTCHASNAYDAVEDQTYVYHDLKDVSCGDTFNTCTSTVCGAHCPDDCENAPSPVYGTGSYALLSSICRSFIHSGILPEHQSGTVIWSNTDNHAPFTSTVEHGIKSQGEANQGKAATPLRLA